MRRNRLRDVYALMLNSAGHVRRIDVKYARFIRVQFTHRTLPNVAATARSFYIFNRFRRANALTFFDSFLVWLVCDVCVCACVCVDAYREWVTHVEPIAIVVGRQHQQKDRSERTHCVANENIDDPTKEM